jgi:hypothetical protein
VDKQQVETKQYWFPAKKYGWGWGMPSAWQGWLTLSLYVVWLGGSAYLFSPEEQPGAFAVSVVIASAFLVFICRVKGEPARWRWGK